ncbi:LTA synthase family protein [Rickettsia endosymbiont of Polydrusus tereticollis]|uniref:LTA synthase family protein n=1 Tax=Rickettsia endosymbiont of Polydrusus tereticollis TaxID=3066251 RepID=UPI003132E5E7
MIKTLFNITAKTYLLFQLITRLSLCIYAIWHKQISFADLPLIFLLGEINDLISCSYFLPVILILTLLFHLILSRCEFLHRLCCYAFYCCFITFLIFISIAEITFWDEFGTKFNFIAVDYLIYTHEIIGTVKESMPYVEISTGIIAIAVVITYLLRNTLINAASNIQIKSHLIAIIILSICSFTAFKFYAPEKLNFSNNRYAVELSKNGPYEFFSAYFNNSLNYNSFYPIIDNARALSVVRTLLQNNNSKFLSTDSIERIITPKTLFGGKYNVMLITVESLSGKFMKSFGNSDNITPHLDKLADNGIFFTNLYATGTRTVRGLEAITLSVPPTPGSSIIRRPDNQNLFNIGTIFKQQGYQINFIFGGYSYFDNFQNYFTGNGYNIIDRSNLTANEISFANIWGVADEDIFNKSLEAADQDYKTGKPFFSLIMTTSNHRPYTFPENRIDLPSGGGRNAAVKYTDYAIGQFLEKAKTKEWFDNTIFVITADHCAASAGKTELPVNKYHIPLIIYAPKILSPQKVANLASQIDIAPTIFGLLGFEYKSKFWGQDILNEPANRAFISTYQLLGFMKDEYLVILSPNSLPKTYKLSPNGKKQEILDLPILTEEAISLYQTAYDFYIQGKMTE